MFEFIVCNNNEFIQVQTNVNNETAEDLRKKYIYIQMFLNY